MKWSWKIGDIKGIPIYLHATFLILLAWIALANLAQGSSAVVSGLLFVSLVFACVLLHELGHALAAGRYGIATEDITLLPIGGLARLKRMPEEPRQELVVALAGPAVNLGIAGAIFLWLNLTTGPRAFESLAISSGFLLERLMVVNLFLAGFNLLPAFPMDGGRVVRALLSLKFGPTRATEYAAGLGQVMAALFAVIGILYNPFLLLIAFFVWIGARQEVEHARMRSAFRGVPVPRAMMTDFETLHPKDDLEKAVSRILSGSQQDFPVLEGDRVVGILTRQRLLESLAEGDTPRFVGEAMERDFPMIESGETLERAFERLQAHQGSLLPVLSEGRLIGLLTAENMGEYMMIRSARERSGRAA